MSTPKHRHEKSSRSGDTIVIGGDGKASNPDAAAREKSAKANSSSVASSSKKAKQTKSSDNN